MGDIGLKAFHFAVSIQRGRANFEFGIKGQAHTGYANNRVAAILTGQPVQPGSNDHEFNFTLDQVIHEQDQNRDDPIHFGQERLRKQRHAHRRAPLVSKNRWIEATPQALKPGAGPEVARPGG